MFANRHFCRDVKVSSEDYFCRMRVKFLFNLNLSNFYIAQCSRNFRDAGLAIAGNAAVGSRTRDLLIASLTTYSAQRFFIFSYFFLFFLLGRAVD